MSFITWFSQILTGSFITISTIHMSEEYSKKQKEKISTTHEIGKAVLVDPEKEKQKKLLEEEVIEKKGSYPDDLPYRVKRHLEEGHYIECPPDDIFKETLRITGIKDPLACEVLKETLMSREDLYKRGIELFEREGKLRRTAQARYFLEEIQSIKHQPMVFECLTCSDDQRSK